MSVVTTAAGVWTITNDVLSAGKSRWHSSRAKRSSPAFLTTTNAGARPFARPDQSIGALGRPEAVWQDHPILHRRGRTWPDRWRRYRGLPQPLPEPEADRNRQDMLAKVRRVWIDGVLQPSLNNLARIELGLEEKPDAGELAVGLHRATSKTSASAAAAWAVNGRHLRCNWRPALLYPGGSRGG